MSKCWSLSGIATEIPNDSDMNTYMTPGNFMCTTNNGVKTLKNCPVDNAFMLKVSSPINSKNYVMQEYIDLAGRQVIRSYSAYDKTWVEKRNATKDDLGKFLTASGSAQAKEGSYIIVTSIKLPAGHTYLVIGSNQVSGNLTSIISSQLAGFNSAAETYSFYLGDSRSTGLSGGGCLCAAIVSTKAECTISLRGYGYSSGTYDYIGKLFAVQLA